MSAKTKNEIIKAEERLKTAMLGSDTKELDLLLSDELIFTNHLGQIMTKADDLNAHESGLLKIKSLDLSEKKMNISARYSIVSVKASICAEFNGEESETVLRFTRIWHKADNNSWQVAAAHSSAVI